jgi:membrane protein YqaA with SNARE-associated domain
VLQYRIVRDARAEDPIETTGTSGWAKKWLLPAAAFGVAIVVTIVLFIYRDSVAEIGGVGYLGTFLISLVSNGTIILPVPGIIVIFSLGATFSPWLIGLTAGAGGAIGELTGYAAGFSGRRILRSNRTYRRAVVWVRRWGVWVVLLFTITPLPLDVVGIAAGALRFPIWKFLLVCFFGKSLLYIGMAFAGKWGWDQIVTGALDGEAIWAFAAAILAVVGVLGLALAAERWSWRRG